jgi:hypothetical protein
MINLVPNSTPRDRCPARSSPAEHPQPSFPARGGGPVTDFDRLKGTFRNESDKWNISGARPHKLRPSNVLKRPRLDGSEARKHSPFHSGANRRRVTRSKPMTPPARGCPAGSETKVNRSLPFQTNRPCRRLPCRPVSRLACRAHAVAHTLHEPGRDPRPPTDAGRPTALQNRNVPFSFLGMSLFLS